LVDFTRCVWSRSKIIVCLLIGNRTALPYVDIEIGPWRKERGLLDFIGCVWSLIKNIVHLLSSTRGALPYVV